MDSSKEYNQTYEGYFRLYPQGHRPDLYSRTVAVVGLGGVGSWAVEALARSGIGCLILCDFDDICISNSNRQLHTSSATVGRLKTQVMQERVCAIYKDIEIACINDPIEGGTLEQLFQYRPDVVIDAIDKVSDKCALIAECVQRQVSIVSSAGAGGRQDPTLVRVDDLSRARGDRLTQKVRRRLRKECGFPEGPSKQKFGVRCIFSEERPFVPESCDTNQAMDCRTGYGASCAVTGTFGFFAASEAIRVLNQLSSTMESD